jgi:predicted enzyme related to lactoylglutathione lyase
MKKLVAWVEVPAVNLERSVKFYNAVLNLNLEILDWGEEKMACFPNDEGAISQSPGFKPSGDGALVSFHVNNIEDTLELVKESGGNIIQVKTKIEAEGRGYFALFSDTEGNKIGLYSD